MYYEEKIIDGVLCGRGTPDGTWIPFTARDLTATLCSPLHKAALDMLEALEDACLSVAVRGEQPPEKWLAALAKAKGVA